MPTRFMLPSIRDLRSGCTALEAGPSKARQMRFPLLNRHEALAEKPFVAAIQDRLS